MGTIKLGNKVIVSDPCYTLDTWCQKILENVIPGTYHTEINRVDGVNAELIVTHEDVSSHYWEEQSDIEVGVDSGQAGIFSAESYRNDEWTLPGNKMFGNIWSQKPGDDWYQKVCDNGEYDEGVCCTSGYGDGSYSLYLSFKDEQVVGIKIAFVEEDEGPGGFWWDEDDDTMDFDDE